MVAGVVDVGEDVREAGGRVGDMVGV